MSEYIYIFSKFMYMSELIRPNFFTFFISILFIYEHIHVSYPLMATKILKYYFTKNAICVIKPLTFLALRK